MATTIRVPIDLTTPEQTGLAGNSFWTIQSGVASQFGYWGFLGNVTGGILYGQAEIPSTVDPNSTGTIVLVMGASATAGSLSMWRVGVQHASTGRTFDVTGYVYNNAINWTAPTTAWARHDMTFDLLTGTTANTTVMIKIERDANGTSGTDNSTATVGLFGAFLVLTATG